MVTVFNKKKNVSINKKKFQNYLAWWLILIAWNTDCRNIKQNNLVYVTVSRSETVLHQLPREFVCKKNKENLNRLNSFTGLLPLTNGLVTKTDDITAEKK